MAADNLETLYSPRTMIEALIQEPAPTTFLTKTLVKKSTVLDTDSIEIDIVKGGQTLSAYVSRESEANNVNKRGYATLNHVAPYIYEQITATPQDLKIRDFGKNAYVSQSPQARMDAKVGEWLKILRDRRIRREEQQIAEGIQTGKIVVSGNGVNFTVDYRMGSDNLVTNTGADLWGSGTENKLEQMRVDAQTISRSGAGTATDLILGEDAAVDYINDADILALLNNRRVEIGEINPVLYSDMRATYLGRISYPGLNLDVWTYDGEYVDASGNIQKYITANKYVMMARTARVEKHYTTIENLKHGTMMGEEFPMWTVAQNGKSAVLSYESGPLAAIHQPDAFVCRTVKAAS